MRREDIQGRVLAAQGDSGAADALIADYLPFIKGETARRIGRIPQEGRDDELSIAMMAFHEAIEAYRPGRGAFLQYAAVAIRRRLIDYHRSERRHMGAASIHQPVGEDGPALEETLAASGETHDERHTREATRQEIQELAAQLKGYGLSLEDVAKNCPRQARTLESCRRVLAYARENPALLQELVRSGRLPLTALSAGAGVEKKTLERHRKYLMALLIIYTNGYELIRGHLRQVFTQGEREAAV